MNDRSIREDHPTEVELLLLRSVQLDAPPRSSKGRALAALGLAAATTAAAGTGGAATAGAVATGLAKWIAVAAVAGLAVGATRTLSPHATTTAPLPVVRAVVNHEVFSAPPLPVRQVEREAPPLAEPALAEPASSTPATTVVPRRASVRASPPPPNPLAAEVASLESVRSALAAHDPHGAGQLLDRHEARFSQPTLGPEAALLRIEVLLALGDVRGARRIGSRLLSEQPDSAYGQRVRSLLEEASPPSAP